MSRAVFMALMLLTVVSGSNMQFTPTVGEPTKLNYILGKLILERPCSEKC